LVVPVEGFATPEEGNQAAREWDLEVNSRIHSEIQARPLARLDEERKLLRPLPSLRPPLRQGEVRKVDRHQTVRFGSARYALPSHLVGHRVEVRAEGSQAVIEQDHEEVVRYSLVGPGEASILDEHYPGHQRQPARGVRPRTASEVSLLGLGPSAEVFLRAAAAAGTSRLAGELAEIVTLEASWGPAALVEALERATRFRRFWAEDLRAVMAAGPGVPNPTGPGARLEMELPAVPMRPLSAYALEAI